MIVRTIIDTINEYFQEDIGAHLIQSYARKLVLSRSII